MTDLSISRDGSTVLIGAGPNPEVPGSGSYQVARYDRHGQLSWRLPVAMSVKSQSLNEDGSIAFVATYDSKLVAINARGKTVWETEASCKPIALGKDRSFLCFHDDDAESDIAFDLYDHKGRKRAEYPAIRDVLGLKMSVNLRHWVMWHAGGSLQVFGLESVKGSVVQPLAQVQVLGEVVDAAILPGKAPRVAALYNEGKAQRLRVWDFAGRLISEGSPSVRVDQLEFGATGTALVAYGNSDQGQYIEYFEAAPAAAKLNSKWIRGLPQFADYSSHLMSAVDLALIGYEEVNNASRLSCVLAFDPSGELRWKLPLISDEGSYFYAYAFASLSRILAVGTDDGNLSVFKF